MSPLSIVAITVVASLTIILLLAASSLIIYGQLQLRRQISTATAALSDHRQTLNLTVKDIAATLESHRGLLDGQISKINGEEISAAGKIIVSSAQRIERSAIAFGELARHLLSEEALGGSDIRRAADSGLAPESFAPNPTGERYTSVSRTAQGDIEAADEQDNDS